MGSFYPDTTQPYEHVSLGQLSQDGQYAGIDDLSQILNWESRSTSKRHTDELDCSSMQKVWSSTAAASSSSLSNNPHCIVSRYLDTSDYSNGEALSATESSDLERYPGSYPAPTVYETPQESQRYYCRFKGCRSNKGFARIGDLNKHQKMHYNNTTWWYCGCCRDKTDGYKTLRKDHLKQHLRTIHQMEAHYDCPGIPFSGKGEYLFSSEACVEEYKRREAGHTTTDTVTSSGCNCSKRRKEGVPIASKNSEDNSPHTCLRATDGSTRSSPAQSQTIKHLIQTDSKQPPKRRRQDSTYASCDSSEFASTENTTTAAEVSSRGLELVPAINSPTTSMPMDSVFYCFPSMPMDNLCFSPAAWDFSTYEHSYSLIGSPDFTPQGNLGLSQEDSELKDNISKNLGPGADSLLGLSETNPLGREEVPNVHPADFLAIYRTKSSRKMQKPSTATVQLLNIAASASVSYNPRTRTMNLRGPVALLESVKEKLQAIILEVSPESGLQYLQRKQKELQPMTNVNTLHGTWNTSANQTSDGDRSGIIFALRIKQDLSTITTWIDYLLPKLRTILDPALGCNYTASLVRQGDSEADARPHIRIRSPRKLRLATRKNIKQAIDEICELNTRDRIPVSIRRDFLRLLASTPSSHSVTDDKSLSIESEEDEEDEEDDPAFRTKRYWQNLGMGASIGMGCTRTVSATSGGYVLVDGRKLLLTVDHFIERSYNGEPPVSQHQDRITITSPSLSDVDDMRGRLDASLRDLNAEFNLLSKKPGDGEISLNDAPSLRMEQIMYAMGFCQEFQSEITRPDQIFILGNIDKRCQTRSSLSFDAESSSSSESATSSRMDWALFDIRNHRIGENRHRFGTRSDFEEINWTGDGDFCSETCELEPNASVHYVGQRSGRRTCQVNAVPMLINDNGICTYEWTLICPGLTSSKQCEGDSGAWVLNSDNNVVGMLWGFTDGQLIFSDIIKVFADIQNVYPAREVRLPHNPIHREPSVVAISGRAIGETVLICGVKEPKRARPYKLSTVMPSRRSNVQSRLPAKGSIGNEAAPSHDQLSSYSSVKLNISSPVEYLSASRIADASSIEQLSANKEPESKCKQVVHVFHNQHGKISKTDPGLDSITHERRQRVRAGSAGSECVSHMKCQSPLRYIRSSGSTNLLAIHSRFLSKSHLMKPMCKSNTFPYSKKDAAAQSRRRDFKSSSSYLRIGKLKDLSQSKHRLTAARRIVEIVA